MSKANDDDTKKTETDLEKLNKSITKNTNGKDKNNSIISSNEKELKDLKKEADKDKPKENKKKTLANLYSYWVYITKNGEPISDFGVNEEDYEGVKLLVRRKDEAGEKKVIFAELYPEPSFDQNYIRNNQQTIRKELNKLKQIEKELLDNYFLPNPKPKNYTLSDVRLLINKYEIELESIRYGVTNRYIHKHFRDDGIPCIWYELENSGLRLVKYVKEKNIITHASEEKKIKNQESQKQINKTLKRKNDTNWQKIALFAIWTLLTIGVIYGLFEFLNYNQERAFAETKQQLEEVILQQQEFIDEIVSTMNRNYNADNQIIRDLIGSNDEILNACITENNNGVPIAR